MALMNITTNEDYKVLVTHLPAGEPNGQQCHWRAMVLGFPDLVAEADSREQVIKQIESLLYETLGHSEIVTVTTPARLLATTYEPEDALLAQGWDDHGLFKDDPEALKLFDEIEEERNRHLVGKTS
jgi:hypothetical protein